MNKRLIFLISGWIDAVLGGFLLLIFFGLIPLDFAAWNTPRWVAGFVGALLLFFGIGMLAYQLTRTDASD